MISRFMLFPQLLDHEKRERIIALDLLRGSFLLIIFINHLAWAPSLFSFFTGSSHLAASAAEGFFVISGILIGYIYGVRMIKNAKDTFKKLFKRAAWLYLLSISFTFAYSLIASSLHPDYMRTFLVFSDHFSNITEYVYEVLTLQFVFGWADFLARYAVFMLIAPFALWAISRGFSWLVIITSLIAWYLCGITDPGLFLPWVILFFPSIIIGYYLKDIEAFINRKNKKKMNRLFYSTLLPLSIITYGISVIATTVAPHLLNAHPGIFSANILHLLHILTDTNTYLQATILNRDTMGIGRVVIGILWFWTLYILYRKYEHLIDRKTYGVLLLFGMNSLYVYGWSSVIIMFTDVYLPPIEWRSVLLNTMVVTNLILLLIVITKKRYVIKDVRKKISRGKIEI